MAHCIEVSGTQERLGVSNDADVNGTSSFNELDTNAKFVDTVLVNMNDSNNKENETSENKIQCSTLKKQTIGKENVTENSETAQINSTEEINTPNKVVKVEVICHNAMVPTVVINGECMEECGNTKIHNTDDKKFYETDIDESINEDDGKKLKPQTSHNNNNELKNDKKDIANNEDNNIEDNRTNDDNDEDLSGLSLSTRRAVLRGDSFRLSCRRQMSQVNYSSNLPSIRRKEANRKYNKSISLIAPRPIDADLNVIVVHDGNGAGANGNSTDNNDRVNNNINNNENNYNKINTNITNIDNNINNNNDSPTHPDDEYLFITDDHLINLLPRGWESRIDIHGRIFYIDHNDKTTTWRKPAHTTNYKNNSNNNNINNKNNKNNNNSNTNNSSTNINSCSISTASTTNNANNNIFNNNNNNNNTNNDEVDNTDVNVVGTSINTNNNKNNQQNNNNITRGTIGNNNDNASNSNNTTNHPENNHNNNKNENNNKNNNNNIINTTTTAANNKRNKNSEKNNINNGQNQTLAEAERRIFDIINSKDDLSMMKRKKMSSLPALEFLCRPDLFVLIENNSKTKEIYDSNEKLKQVINIIRRDLFIFDKFQYRKDLANLLNCFVDKNKPLPVHWELKKDAADKSFFIDHKHKTTTYIDPRLPSLPQYKSDVLKLRDSQLPSVEEDETMVTSRVAPLDYSDRIVAFLSQNNIIHIIRHKYPSINNSPSLQQKIAIIRAIGQDGLRTFRNDLEFSIMLSVFDEDIASFQPGNSTSAQPKSMLEHKIADFYKKLRSKGYCKGPIKYKLIIDREKMLEDAFVKIMSLKGKALKHSKLLISFKGEEGVDFGGPSREFFYLLSRSLFNPYYGLFSYSANDTYTIHISALAHRIEHNLEWFRFSGRVVALSIIHQYLLDVFFTRVFYKHLLQQKPVLKDLESVDAEFYRSLSWINNEATSEEIEELGLTFSVNEDVTEGDEDHKKQSNPSVNMTHYNRLIDFFNVIKKKKNKKEFTSKHPRKFASNIDLRKSVMEKTIRSSMSSGSTNGGENNAISSSVNNINEISYNNEKTWEDCYEKDEEIIEMDKQNKSSKVIEVDLKPNGSFIKVTEKNRKEYVAKMVEWRVSRSSTEQMAALIKGFNEVLDAKLVQQFDSREVELLIAGSAVIDIQDWRKHTIYKNGYTDQHRVVRWFWKLVESYSNEQRLRLLQFVTGTSSIPIEGFSALRGSVGPKKFCIEKWGKVTDLPRSHTCFNRIDLPPYTSFACLCEKLTIAVQESSTFGIA